MSKSLPKYTEKGRYPYHWLCTRIEPASESFKKLAIESPTAPQWAKERTHGCYCSAWKQKEDGTFTGGTANGWSPFAAALKANQSSNETHYLRHQVRVRTCKKKRASAHFDLTDA